VRVLVWHKLSAPFRKEHQQHRLHQPPPASATALRSALRWTRLLRCLPPILHTPLSLLFCVVVWVYDICTQKDPAGLHPQVLLLLLLLPAATITSCPPLTMRSSANSNIRHIQARAAAQVVSTARNVLPAWTASYFLPASTPSPSSSPSSPSSPHPLDHPDSPSSPTQHPPDGASATAATDPASVDPSRRDRLAGFDVLRGQDVLVSAKDDTFTVFHVGDRAGDLEELCAYTCSHPILAVKVSSLQFVYPTRAYLL
jgi:hypothetical protein